MERDGELGAVRDHLSLAADGGGSILLIDAPPGSGKTRLLNAAGDMARDHGVRVLGATAAELERAFPFGVAMQLFEPLWFSATDRERDVLAQGPARRASELLTGSLPEAGGRAADQAYSIIHGLFWLCCNLTVPPASEETVPVVMLVDDAQWADAASLRFLAYLAQRIENLPISLIVSTRAGEPSADDSALGAVRAAAATTPLRPRPLSRRGVSELIRRRFPDFDDAFCESSTRLTGGNPFLVMELLAQVETDGDLAEQADADRLAEVPPEAVLNSVAGRLAPLPPAAQAVARALAVLGDGATLQQVARLAELDEATTVAAADILATAHFLHPGTPLTFVHPLVRAAVRQWMPAMDRAQAHRRAAAILQAEDAPRELIAAHLLAAPPGSDPAAIDILRSAARSALAKGAADEAVHLLERAIKETPPPGLYPDLLSELAEAEVAAGLPQAVERLENAISIIAESPKRTRLALTQGRALIEAGRYEEAAAVLRAARAEAGGADAELVDELDAAYIAAAYGVPALVEHAEALAADLRSRIGGRPATAAQHEVLAHMAARAAMRGEPRPAVTELADLAWADGAVVGFEETWERSAMLITSALFFADELERNLEICEAAIAQATDRSSPTSFVVASYLRAWPRYQQGLIAEAVIDAEAALDVRLDRWEVYARGAYGAVACAHMQRGQHDEAETALSLLDHPSVVQSVNAPFLLDARSQLRLAEMRPREALHDALEAGRLLELTLGATSPGVIPWRSTAALAHLALGDSERAWKLAAEELELARQANVTRIIIRNLRIQGLVLRGKKGVELLAEAVAIGDRYPRRLEHIHALVDLGAALRRSNQRAAAREPLERALELARQGGLAALAERARTELQASGARARRAMLTGVDSLTPSQRRVAELAGQGLTTRMIAEALFITPKTVEFHLRQIYQKLSIGSRAELTAALAGDPSDLTGQR